MRQLLWVFLIALLYGCASQMTVHPVSQENVVTDPAKATQNIIDETNAALTAAYTTVLNGFQSGAMTKAEATAYQSDLDKASKYIDGAAVFLDSGDVTSAQGQIKLANSIIGIVQSKLIELKKEGK